MKSEIRPVTGAYIPKLAMCSAYLEDVSRGSLHQIAVESSLVAAVRVF